MTLACPHCGRTERFEMPQWTEVKHLDRGYIFGARGTAYRTTHSCGAVVYITKEMALNLRNDRQREPTRRILAT